MNLFSRTVKVVTHDGSFHPDEVFACAALSLWAEKNNKKLKIIRTREKAIIEKADMVVDMGGIFDSNTNRFDHHQKNRAGQRENQIPYASFGLVWKKYGVEICNDPNVAFRIDQALVVPIDAKDNGVNFSKNNEASFRDCPISEAIYNLNFIWQINKTSPDELFKKALTIAKDILVGEIAAIKVLANDKKETLEAIKVQNEPEILILDKNLEWCEAVAECKNIKFVISPRKEKSEWAIQVGRDNLEDYNSDRIKFPGNWFGLVGEDLEKVSGIKGALFCANGGWFAIAKTKEGVLAMANKALQIAQN